MREWLPSLNPRQKSTETRPDLKIGDVVLVISPDCPRAHWPLGRMLAVFPGQDGHVGVAKIQVGQNTVVRLISKCVVWSPTKTREVMLDKSLTSQEGENVETTEQLFRHSSRDNVE